MLINEKVKKLVEKFEILEKLENIEELEKIEISKNMKSSTKIYTIMLKRMKIRKKTGNSPQMRPFVMEARKSTKLS